MCFYEHLADDPVALREMPRWVDRDIFDDVGCLLERRLTPDQFKRLARSFGQRRSELGSGRAVGGTPKPRE